MRRSFRRRLEINDDSASRLGLPSVIFGPALAWPIGQVLAQQEGANLLWLVIVLIVVVAVVVLLWKSVKSTGLGKQFCWLLGALAGFAGVALSNAACHVGWNLPIVFGPGYCLVFVTIMFFWRLNIELMLRL